MDAVSPFKSIGTHERLRDRVVGELERLIVGGVLAPGAKLPPQTELADQLGVSRTALREAIHVLITKGLLTAKPGVGTAVRELANDHLSGPISLVYRTHGFSLDNLHQVRTLLEVEIATLACQKATAEDVQRMRQILAAMEATQTDDESFAALDADFHQALADATQNPLLAMLLQSIRDVVHEVRLEARRHPGLRSVSILGHHKILQQIEVRDADGARRAMQEHLVHARGIHQDLGLLGNG
jgi:GntR family transcriptional regulator, transcriptional repressor for pyruvate dehydrogenase complex